MDKNNTGKRDDSGPKTVEGTSHEEKSEARSERYRRKVEALNDCMLE